MCETRQRTREERQTYQEKNGSSTQQRRPQRRPQRSFSGAPQGRRTQQTVKDSNGNTYRLVPDRRQ